MNIITLDFETYYSQTFSLSKMTTEEYIRSPEFEVIGVAVQLNDELPRWVSGTKKQIQYFLDSYDMHEAMVIAHNAVFDMAILNWHFGIKPKRIVDTLSMARAIHGTEVGGSLAKLAEHYNLGVKGTEVVNALGKTRIDFTADELSKYGKYCRNDVILTYGLFQQLAKDFPLVEYKLIDLTIRMFTEPSLELDEQLLIDHLRGVKNEKEILLDLVEADREELMSNDKFAKLLKDYGAIPPRKISPTTGKETWAFAKTDEAFKALLEHPIH